MGAARLLVAAIFAMVTLGSVGTLQAEASGPSACPPGGRTVCLDRADSGHTVHVRVRQEVQVMLAGTALDWNGLRQVAPRLLRLRGRATIDGTGSLIASYLAVRAGRTALQASGAPRCSPGKACPQFMLLWRVRVVVN
jgi:hypothetical protein